MCSFALPLPRFASICVHIYVVCMPRNGLEWDWDGTWKGVRVLVYMKGEKENIIEENTV